MQIGGTGFFEDGGRRLEDEIDQHYPDYDLYLPYVNDMVRSGRKSATYFLQYTNYFIGFVTRGCPRRCQFCVVRFNPHCRYYAHPSTFVDLSDKRRRYISLWDDNVLAYPKWNEVFDELDDIGIPYQFRQGLDIRLITPEKAQRIAKAHTYGDIIFAFDHWRDKDIIEEKLKIWRTYCTKRTKAYVLTGYDARAVNDPRSYISEGDTMEEKDYIDILHTFMRIEILMRYKCIPYVMRHENYHQSKYASMYVQIARWTNQQSMFKRQSFREWVACDQRHVTTMECSSSRALRSFLQDHPDFPGYLLNMKWTDY